MFVSKSFGYALRGILYVATMASEGKRTTQIEEIANSLKVPKYFLGKIMNKVVKAKILDSSKGQHGGFSINDSTLTTPLLRIMEVTDGGNLFANCVLGFRNCDPAHPCPLHNNIGGLRDIFKDIFMNNKIGDLLNSNSEAMIDSIAIRS